MAVIVSTNTNLRVLVCGNPLCDNIIGQHGHVFHYPRKCYIKRNSDFFPKFSGVKYQVLTFPVIF